MIRFKRIIVATTLLMSAYIFGGLTTYYKWFPYVFLSIYKNSLLDRFNDKSNSINNYFVNPVISKDTLIFPKITSRKQLKNIVLQWEKSFDIKTVTKDVLFKKKEINGPILKLVYSINGYQDSLYAYYKKFEGAKNTTKGALIVPGSGINQSSEIYYKKNILNNYQCNIDDLLQDYGDIFIYIKPNEDILAIHNGQNKIEETTFVNYLLNKGFSYSEYYITQTLVLGEFIKRNYNQTLTAGLSQGGLAAFINSLYLKPNQAIISSGYSVLMDTPYLSNLRQIIMPGYKKKIQADSVYEIINKSPTRYLFTYGEKESGIYGDESVNFKTKKHFQGLKNIQVRIHEGGHIFPEKEIKEFVYSKE